MAEITCTCKTCNANATRLGKPLPLRAQVSERLLASLGGKTHGLVHMANDPSTAAGWARTTSGVTA